MATARHVAEVDEGASRQRGARLGRHGQFLLSDKISVMLLPSGNGTIFDLKSLLGQAAPSPSPSAAP